MSEYAERLKGRLRQDLKAAMQARRTGEVKLLRVVLAAIDNAEAVPMAERPRTEVARFADGSAESQRRTLSEADLQHLLEGEIASRLAAADDYRRLGRSAEAELLSAEAETVRRYLAM